MKNSLNLLKIYTGLIALILYHVIYINGDQTLTIGIDQFVNSSIGHQEENALFKTIISLKASPSRHVNLPITTTSSLNGIHFRFTSVEVFIIWKKIFISLPFIQAVSNIKRPPFVTVQSFPNGSVFFNGFCFEIINSLKKMYNFTYDVTVPKDKAFGTNIGNGSWSGMIGMVLNKESDVGVGPISVTYARQQVIDFTIGFYEERTNIIIPPLSQETRLFACTKPFQTKIWIGLLCAVAVLPLITRMLTRPNFESSQTKVSSSLTQSYIFFYGVLTTQSGLGSRFNSSHSSAILAVTWCLIVVVLIHAYIGTLISFMSVPKLKPIIFALEDLPSSGLDWVVRAGTDLDTLFTRADKGIYKAIGDGLRRHPELLTRSETLGPQKVLNGSSAYILGKSLSDFIIEQEYRKSGQCRLSSAREEFFKVYQAFVFPKSSPYKNIFNKKILHMIESGLTEYWRKQLWPSVHQCDVTSQNYGPRSLTFDDMQSPFLIWSIGTGLALIAFIIEHFHFRCARNTFRTNNQRVIGINAKFIAGKQAY